MGSKGHWLGACAASLLLLACPRSKPSPWADFEQCLLGAQGVEPVKVPVLLREAQLAERTMVPLPGMAPWPDRCAAHADALFADMRGAKGDPTLRASLDTALACGGPTGCKFSTQGPPKDGSELVCDRKKRACWPRNEGPVMADPVALWTAASAAGLAGRGSAVPGPRRLVPKLSGAETELCPKAFPWDYQRAALDDGRAEVVFAKEGDSTKVARCVLGDRAECRWLSGFPAGKTKLRLDRAGLPRRSLLVLDAASNEGPPGDAGFWIPEVTEAPLAFGRVSGLVESFVRKNAREPAMQVLVTAIEGGKVIGRAHHDIPDVERPPALIGSWLYGFEEKVGSRLLVMQHLDARGAAASVPAYPRRYPADRRPSYCQDDQGSLALYAFQDGELRAWFADGDDFGPPVSHALSSRFVEIGHPECSRGRIAQLWASGADEQLARTICDAKGCVVEEVPLPFLRVSEWVDGRVSGDVAVILYRSEFSDLRALVGPLRELVNRDPVVLWDEQDQGGARVRDVRHVLLPARAVFFAEGDTSRFAAHLDADGSFGVYVPEWR